MGQKYCKLKSNLDKADQRCLETKAWVAAKTDWPQPFRTAYSAWCPSCSRSRPARQRSLGRWVGCQRSLLEPCIAGSTFQCSDLEAWRSRAWPDYDTWMPSSNTSTLQCQFCQRGGPWRGCRGSSRSRTFRNSSRRRFRPCAKGTFGEQIQESLQRKIAGLCSEWRDHQVVEWGEAIL